MREINQNDLEHLQDLLVRGQISAEDANIEMIRAQRVKLVLGKIPRNVRTALDSAVKYGKLGHLKKEGKKPEAYFHPDFEYLAKQDRAEHERKVINALLKSCI